MSIIRSLRSFACIASVTALLSACSSDDAAEGGGQGGESMGGSGPASGGSSSASGGSTSLPGEQVQVIQKGALSTWTWGESSLVVDESAGARIVSFSLKGKEILLPSSVQGQNYGSTFWTSPQSQWGWPPVEEIDSDSYSSSVVGSSVTFSGTVGSVDGTDVSVVKVISVDAPNDLVNIEYRLNNHSSDAASFALWEVTRVAAGGLTFYPQGSSAFTPSGSDDLPTQEVDGVSFYDHSAFTQGNQLKVHADGEEGWLAHADSELLFIKAFKNIAPSDIAPDEGEVEIFASADGTYVEVENQSAYAEIAAGASATYRVQWLLRELEPGVSVTPGNAALVSQVRAEVASLP